MNTIKKLNDYLYAIDTPFPFSQGSYSRSYMVIGNDGMILVDAGSTNTYQQIIDLLTQLGEDKSRLKLIALTHAHGDHVGAVNSIKKATGCLVVVHRDGAELLSNIELMFQDFMGSFPNEYPITQSIRESWFSIASESSNPDIQFREEGFRLDMGGVVLEAILAPGHSKDSVCWYEPQRKWLFTGDAICGLGPFSEAPCYRDVEVYRGTLERIGMLPIEKLFTAHFPVMDGLSAAEFINKSMNVIDQYDVLVKGQLRSGEKPSLKGIASTMARAIGKECMVNTLFTARAHLLDLEKRGYEVKAALGVEREN